ncbi:hypothetical protein [Vitiosangium sp. GDMCC 1.1324]|uniref:hypothetical protein n=1 Tax=Vitiosangium sp. (strain GDMCC 1.1324) TaxID=2138576 RepID=UPI000D371CE0|nr:hypothetical protein [Vitiosangium sp. GDMCC 1.1324]PTL77816.1 hypothetical protein DAT35_42190 [Vitiosangium sp. GDMCC 1.1324]
MRRGLTTLWALVPALALASTQEVAPLEELSPAAPAAPSVRVSGDVRLVGGVDTGFEPSREDGLGEHVVDGWGRASLATDMKLSSTLRLVVEGRALWRGGAQKGLERAKSSFEPYVGEAFLDVYTRWVDVRVGQQTLAFGANAFFAPTDILNPRDLRQSFVELEPEDLKLPVFGARALATVGPLTVTGVWVPFFFADRYDVFGQDMALLQPPLGVGVPISVDPSVEDGLQPHLLETERPGLPGDLGLRVTGDVGRVKLGGSWVWANEKLPQVTFDPELDALLRARERGEPADAALLLSLQDRLRAGETLVTGRYARQHVVAAEASTLVGPAQLDVDLGFSPSRTFYDDRLRPLRKPAVSWVVGMSQAEESDLVYSLTYTGLAVPRVGEQELLFLLEPGTARGQAHTAFFHLLVGDVAYSLLGGQLSVGLRGAFEPVQRSFLVAPRVGWRVSEHVHLGLSAEVYGGPPFSAFGYFNRNDQVLASLRVTL